MSEINYVCMALIALTAIIGVLTFLKVNAKNDSDPIVTANVRLIKKQKTPGPRLGWVHFSVFFLTDNEELLEFSLPSELQFDSYHEGDCGTLTYQGSNMIKFERTHINVQP